MLKHFSSQKSFIQNVNNGIIRIKNVPFDKTYNVDREILTQALSRYGHPGFEDLDAIFFVDEKYIDEYNSLIYNIENYKESLEKGERLVCSYMIPNRIMNLHHQYKLCFPRRASPYEVIAMWIDDNETYDFDYVLMVKEVLKVPTHQKFKIIYSDDIYIEHKN